MNEENQHLPSEAEARAALSEVAQTLTQTRSAIARSFLAPMLVLWGAVWIVMLSYAQFHHGPNRIWWVFILAGFVGSLLLRTRYPAPIKRKPDWRVAAFWLVIFAYAAVFLLLLEPWSLLQNLSAADERMLDLKISAYFIIVPMFAYVLFGLWVGRFFVWLGLLVTALVLGGYHWLPDYFYLWVGLMGGGSLIGSGVFIKKFWK